MKSENVTIDPLSSNTNMGILPAVIEGRKQTSVLEDKI